MKRTKKILYFYRRIFEYTKATVTDICTKATHFVAAGLNYFKRRLIKTDCGNWERKLYYNGQRKPKFIRITGFRFFSLFIAGDFRVFRRGFCTRVLNLKPLTSHLIVPIFGKKYFTNLLQRWINVSIITKHRKNKILNWIKKKKNSTIAYF